MLCFLIVPAVYVIEHVSRKNWAERTCVSADEWCAANMLHGVATAYMPSCIAADGINYLAEYCTRCTETVVIWRQYVHTHTEQKCECMQ